MISLGPFNNMGQRSPVKRDDYFRNRPTVGELRLNSAGGADAASDHAAITDLRAGTERGPPLGGASQRSCGRPGRSELADPLRADTDQGARIARREARSEHLRDCVADCGGCRVLRGGGAFPLLDGTLYHGGKLCRQ